MNPGEETRHLPVPSHANDLVQDLGLDVVINAAASGDRFIADVVSNALLNPATTVEQVQHRHQVLTDVLAQPALIRDLYRCTVEALEAERGVRRSWFTQTHSTAALRRAVDVVSVLMDHLRELRRLAEDNRDLVQSAPLQGLLERQAHDLAEDYLDEVSEYLRALRSEAISVDAHLGKWNSVRGYELHRPPAHRPWKELAPPPLGHAYTFVIPPRDDAGADALSAMRDRSVGQVAEVLDRSARHILGWLTELRTQTAFYLGCVNLDQALVDTGTPTCLPTVTPAGDGRLTARGLRDPALALRTGGPVVGNDVEGDGKLLLLITGANSGGKSTFLRSLGLAQMMAQAGMPVAAEQATLDLRTGVFTHFRREEDASMTSGKLDEELRRMSGLVDRLPAGGLVLLNESFASTYEHEGTAIATDVVTALMDRAVRVAYVTHMYALAHAFTESEDARVLPLHAERSDDGTRTFRILPGSPAATSHAVDLWDTVFGAEQTTA